MIRIVTLGAFDDTDLAWLGKTLYTAFGLGTELAGERKLPASAELADGRYDAVKLLQAAGAPRTVADDKILYLAIAELALAPGPLGEPPAWGYAQQGGERAVVSTHRLPARGSSEASVEIFRKRLARECVHFIGHLWELHHCYDARCAMHPSWSPALGANPDGALCNYCREKSERKVRAAKS